MACRRSAVRSRLAPPISGHWPVGVGTRFTASPSSRGLGHHPFTVDTGVRIPVGTPLKTKKDSGNGVLFFATDQPLFTATGHRLAFAALGHLGRRAARAAARCRPVGVGPNDFPPDNRSALVPRLVCVPCSCRSPGGQVAASNDGAVCVTWGRGAARAWPRGLGHWSLRHAGAGAAARSSGTPPGSPASTAAAR